MLLGRLHGLDRQGRRRFRECREDAAGVKPPHAECSEQVIPVDVARLQLAGRRVAPVGHAHGAADPEAALGEIETIADAPADAVIRPPLQKIGAYAPLHDEVFDQVADLVVDEGGDHGRLQTEAFSQAAGHVVLTAPFPGREAASGADAALARVEAEHDLAERDLVERALGLGLDRERHDGDSGFGVTG